MCPQQCVHTMCPQRHIVAHDVSWATQTGKHLLRTQNVSEQNQKHFLCPPQMLRARANGGIFVSATMCPQQCVCPRLSGPLGRLNEPCGGICDIIHIESNKTRWHDLMFLIDS